MSETAGPRRVAADSLQVGDRFLLGETIVTVKARGGESFWSPELGGSFSYSGLNSLFPNGVPLLPPAEPEKPKEWQVQFKLCGPGCRARFLYLGKAWDPTEWLSNNFSEGVTYSVTIVEVTP